MRYLFKKDTFLATLSIFLVIAILLHNPLNPHLFNPLKISLTDFALTDLAFSASHLKSTVDDRIVIVNIDTAGRQTIASLLNSLEAYHPRVIGLDLLLPARASPGNEDLEEAIRRSTCIVLSQAIQYRPATKDYVLSGNEFVHDGSGMQPRSPGSGRQGNSGNLRSGFVNFVSEQGSVVRYFPPFLRDDRAEYESFAAAIANAYDSAAYQRLAHRDKEVEWINYQRPDSGYYTIRFSDFLQNRVDSGFVRDKIVLVGYIGKNPGDVEDKHFTPLNPKILGRSLPDMNGIIIHANILTMILDGVYIARAPGWLTILIAVILTWLHVAFLIRYYIHRHFWFHLAVKMAELVVSILVFYISILLLRYLDVNIDFTLTLIAIILAVDVFYFYEALSHWLSRRFGFPSVFNQKHDHP
jgi:CHASE2 domain-containing sensor protein